MVNPGPSPAGAEPPPVADLRDIGRRAGPELFAYDARDAALYALSVGAGPEELPLFYEGCAGGMKVLPTFCLVGMHSLSPHFDDLFHDYHRVEAGEHLRVYRPLTVPDRLHVSAEIANIWDKGSLAIMRTRVEGRADDGDLVFELFTSSAMLGSGGFGGDPGPRMAKRAVPARPPDVCWSAAIPGTQAILYQLNGVTDPIHVDPEFARSRGFERPILHGPATLGYAALALVREFCDGNPDRLTEIDVRFSAPVVPGDTLTVEAWRTGAGEVLFSAATEEATVLSQGRALIDDDSA